MARLQQTLSNVSEETGRDNRRVRIVGGSVATDVIERIPNTIR